MQNSIKKIAGYLFLTGQLFINSTLLASPLNVVEVAKGIYVHQGVHEDFDENYHGDIANIGFIVGKDAVAIIDTGGTYQVGMALRESVREVTSLPIRYVINTHVHPDHIFGNAAFEIDQPIYIGHRRLANAMYTRQDIYLKNLQNQLGENAKGSRIILPSLSVENTLTLNLGEREIELREWPTAHSSNDLTIIDLNTETLWLSDLLFVERTPSIDGDINGWLRVIEKLKAIPSKLSIPGHGSVTTDKNKKLDDMKRYLQLLLNDVRNSIKNKVSMTTTMLNAASIEKDSWVLFQSVNKRNVNIIYPVLEWE